MWVFIYSSSQPHQWGTRALPMRGPEGTIYEEVQGISALLEARGVRQGSAEAVGGDSEFVFEFYP